MLIMHTLFRSVCGKHVHSWWNSRSKKVGNIAGTPTKSPELCLVHYIIILMFLPKFIAM